MYLYKVNKASTRVKNALLPLKYVGHPSEQVDQLVKTVDMKYQTLSILRRSVGVAHKELELSYFHNVLLAQQLVYCMNSTIEVVSQSFDFFLDQVEYFHHHLTHSKEKISWIKLSLMGR